MIKTKYIYEHKIHKKPHAGNKKFTFGTKEMPEFFQKSGIKLHMDLDNNYFLYIIHAAQNYLFCLKKYCPERYWGLGGDAFNLFVSCVTFSARLMVHVLSTNPLKVASAVLEVFLLMMWS